MSYDDPKIKYLEPDEKTRKHNEAIDEQMAKQERHAKKRACILMLIDRMKRRAGGRERMKQAERKRRIKAAKLAGGVVSPHYRRVGETKVEGDKPFYYAEGALWKDGLGNHALEVIGRIVLQPDRHRHGGWVMKIAIAIGITLIVFCCVVALIFSATALASTDTITKETYGNTTYYTDQDGRSAVSQTIGGQTTLYDNGSGLVDSGKVTLDE